MTDKGRAPLISLLYPFLRQVQAFLVQRRKKHTFRILEERLLLRFPYVADFHPAVAVPLAVGRCGMSQYPDSDLSGCCWGSNGLLITKIPLIAHVNNIAGLKIPPHTLLGENAGARPSPLPNGEKAKMRACPY